jgi:hypothetical protein
MKGGNFRRWSGNQNHVVNWSDNGSEIKTDAVRKFPYLKGNWGLLVTNPEFYFRRGITYSYLTSGNFSARISPGGFIFDVAGSSLFPNDIPLVLAVMNSDFAAYALKLINPTVNFQVGDLARLPIPNADRTLLHGLVERAIALARTDSEEDETTYDFIAPPAWPTGPRDVATRASQLATIERQIDEEVYRLYGIGPEDRSAIEAELSEPTTTVDADDATETSSADASAGDDEAVSTSKQLSMPALAQQWVSYAVGIVLGRFPPGIEGAIGRGCFACDVATALRDVVDDDGIAAVDGGHPDDLVPRVERALELMLGSEQAERVIATATGGKPLAAYLTRDFFKQHVQRYRKRPVYWLLQSPRRTYSLLVFHERLTPDSLYLIMGNRYLGAKVNATRVRIEELRAAAQAVPQGRERRRLEGELDGAMTVLCDLEEFSRLLGAVTSQVSERGEVVGWRPEIDDGVLINLAPLQTLMPAWSAEPKKAWEALKRGEYDWSHTAMRYWPERVRAACAANRSYAIAHGLATVETGVSNAR